VQVAHGRLDQVGLDLHGMQDRLGAQQQQRAAEADHHGQPQRLAHQRPDLGEFARAITLGNFRRGGQQSTGHQQVHRDPDRITQAHRRQVLRAHAPGHHRIDEAHRGGCQLANHDRQGQRQQATHFPADAGGAGEGSGGSVHVQVSNKKAVARTADSTR